MPPNTAAKKPTAIAPYKPAAAPKPGATSKASATGNATTMSVTPKEIPAERMEVVVHVIMPLAITMTRMLGLLIPVSQTGPGQVVNGSP